MSKFESKRSKSLDYIAYSGFKDFDQKNFILRAKHEILKKYAIYVFIESQKVLIVCIFALGNIGENIEGDANLNHPPE